ncbi:MAG: hypothetical protein ACTSVU_09730 [Promethearchaeota archaeon]
MEKKKHNSRAQGLPKFGTSVKSHRHPRKIIRMGGKSSKRTSSQKTYKNKYSPTLDRETKFMPCNSTNITIIKDYFQTVAPQIFDELASSNKYILYQLEDISHDIFLVPTTMTKIVKKLTRNLPIIHAGIHLGYMRRKRTHTGFQRAFYLSYEGGEFVFNLIKKSYPSLLSQIQVIQIDDEGEKAFLYGRDLSLNEVVSETEKLMKKKVIFVENEIHEFLGLALLMVKQAGSKKPEKNSQKVRDEYSRSPNFILSLLNLSDAGYYLRKGH